MKQTVPEISIIMGVYNCEGTVVESIESILCQTYQNFEFIICDDGSTDSTASVVKEFADKYPDKIVFISNGTNKGLNYTLNHCLQIAKGKYIARMDADDKSLPNRLEVEHDFLENHEEFAIVSSALDIYDDDGIWGKRVFKPEPQPLDIMLSNTFSHSACMVRKEAYDKVGGYTDEKRLMRVEDYHLWVKMYAAGYRGCNLEQVLYLYRDDRDSYSKRKLKYRFNSYYVSMIAIKTFNLPKYYYIYKLSTIIIGMLPYGIYKVLHKKRLTKDFNEENSVSNS